MNSVNNLLQGKVQNPALWEILLERLAEIESAKLAGKKYSAMAVDFGVAPSTFSEGLARAKLERDKQQSHRPAPKFGPQLPTAQSQPEPPPQNRNNADLIEGLDRFASATKELKVSLDKHPHRAGSHVERVLTEAANAAASQISESIDDAVTKVAIEMEKFHPNPITHKIVLVIAIALFFALAIGYGFGSKSIYYANNKQTSAEADRWRKFSAAYQHSTPEERAAVESFYGRYRGNTGSQ
ncbi:hypothetical protein C9940_00625 [Pseudidiomarina aestuarii]|uniref:Uncharacterized protein n=1 Tax=Pseudidiomarina aestuarii TaxID=624146 RepID=A0A2T4CZ97_9GAMM|nr:hypothetical protein C9940_00625 [Pseudidiomarina aestuarii]